MNRKTIFYRCQTLCLCFLLGSIYLLSGCASNAPQETPVQKDGSVIVGHTLEIKNNDKRLVPLDNKDALAADGLYYAAWSCGNAKPYENKDGDTVDLYDAQLYLLLGEAKSAENAQHDKNTWLAAAEDNYDVQQTEEISCNGQSYTLLTYQCKSKDTPYDRGVSAFCTHENTAVCIELTCQKNFSEDLHEMMTGFLNSCFFITKQSKQM